MSRPRVHGHGSAEGWSRAGRGLAAGRPRVGHMQRHPTPSRVVTMKVSMPAHCMPSPGCSCTTARANAAVMPQVSTHSARIRMVCRARAVGLVGVDKEDRCAGSRHVHLALRQKSAHVVDPTRQLPDGGRGEGACGQRATGAGARLNLCHSARAQVRARSPCRKSRPPTGRHTTGRHAR